MNETSTTVIETVALTHRFGNRTALFDVNLKVRAGRIYGLVGPNGAGKSTLLSMLLGLLQPTSGQVRAFGMPWSPDALLDIGASINGPALYPHLSAADNLRVHAHLLGVDEVRIHAVVDQVGLTHAGRAKARSFSTGMKARLALAIALLGAPEILILDEPQNGLDPEGIRELRATLRDYANDGRTVIVSSHLLDELAHIVDDIGILVDGGLRWQGPIGQLADRGSLEDAFFSIVRSAA